MIENINTCIWRADICFFITQYYIEIDNFENLSAI